MGVNVLPKYGGNIRSWLDSRIAAMNMDLFTFMNSIGYHHSTVNHTEHFVDPISGANTQKVERAWKEGKIWLKRVRRPSTLFQSHLHEIAWRMNNRNSENGLMSAFLAGVKKHLSCNMK